MVRARHNRPEPDTRERLHDDARRLRSAEDERERPVANARARARAHARPPARRHRPPQAYKGGPLDANGNPKRRSRSQNGYARPAVPEPDELLFQLHWQYGVNSYSAAGDPVFDDWSHVRLDFQSSYVHLGNSFNNALGVASTPEAEVPFTLLPTSRRQTRAST